MFHFSVVELVFLELSFELIREAGVRIPGALGNAIGIVGGLIIGQAAVEANIAAGGSVIIVALDGARDHWLYLMRNLLLHSSF